MKTEYEPGPELPPVPNLTDPMQEQFRQWAIDLGLIAPTAQFSSAADDEDDPDDDDLDLPLDTDSLLDDEEELPFAPAEEDPDTLEDIVAEAESVPDDPEPEEPEPEVAPT